MIAGISNAKSTATPQKNDLKSILTIFMMTVYSAPRTMNICNFGKSLPCLVPHFTERLKARARFNPHRYCFVGNGDELSEFFVIEISPSMLNNTKYEICAEILMQMIVAFCELHGVCITSNVGRYYSLMFRQFAESKGLRCTYSRIRGWGNVTPSERFKDFIDGIKVNF